MSEFKYKKRIVDTMLRRRLMTMGAVLIEGPKLCGKSTTAMQQAASVLNMEPGRTLELARLDPKLILQGEVPRLIDEWQLARISGMRFAERWMLETEKKVSSC